MLHGNIGTLHAESLMLHFLPLYQTFILGQDMLISEAQMCLLQLQFSLTLSHFVLLLAESCGWLALYCYLLSHVVDSACDAVTGQGGAICTQRC